MKRIFCILTILLSVGITQINAQGGKTAVPFLLLAPDSRAGGLGESGSGLADNSAAVFWNPAGIAFLSGSEISFTHSNWLPQLNLSDLFYEYVSFRHYMEEISGSLTASLTYMNFGEFIRTNSSGQQIGTFRSFDLAVSLGYATKISNDWGFGTNVRLIHSKLSDKPTEEEKGSGKATTVSFDLAFMWRPEKLDLPFIGELEKKLSVGLNLSNMGPHVSYIDEAQADPLPTNFRLGIAARIWEDDYNSLTYTLDFSKLLVDESKDSTKKKDPFYKTIFTAWADQSIGEEIQDIQTSMGLEYKYGDPEDFQLALRAGFFYEDPQKGNRKFVSFGAGVNYQNIGFDFSYLSTAVFKNGDDHPLSNTLRFTLSVGWGGVPEARLGLPRGL